MDRWPQRGWRETIGYWPQVVGRHASRAAGTEVAARPARGDAREQRQLGEEGSRLAAATTHCNSHSGDAVRRRNNHDLWPLAGARATTARWLVAHRQRRGGWMGSSIGGLRRMCGWMSGVWIDDNVAVVVTIMRKKGERTRKGRLQVYGGNELLSKALLWRSATTGVGCLLSPFSTCLLLILLDCV
ncbi:ATP-dependent helicase HrpB [Sesbania bispinosa]|nr:ATP-dependent helicase HrpB [Sesbania bispinosa]